MSPSGIDAFRRKKQQKETARAQWGGDRVRADYFSLKANQYAVLRFLEEGDEITYADIHRVPVEGQRYPVDFVCLDTKDDGTPCPGCQSDTDEVRKKTTKGYFNVIWREGPVYARDENGRPERDANKKPVITGRADGVFLWKCSWTVLDLLMEKDSKYHGLMSRDFEVKRTGSSMQDTKYHIDPVDVDSGPQPMQLADMQLAAGKYDLKDLTRPMSFEEFATILATGSFSNGPQPTMDRSAAVPTVQGAFSQGGDPQVRASAFQRG